MRSYHIICNNLYCSHFILYANQELKELQRNIHNNYSKGISATTAFLELFFRNLLFGEKNELHSRALHVAAFQSALLKFLKDHPEATQNEIAIHIGKSPRTVKRMTPFLIERGLLERETEKETGNGLLKI